MHFTQLRGTVKSTGQINEIRLCQNLHSFLLKLAQSGSGTVVSGENRINLFCFLLFWTYGYQLEIMCPISWFSLKNERFTLKWSYLLSLVNFPCCHLQFISFGLLLQVCLLFQLEFDCLLHSVRMKPKFF